MRAPLADFAAMMASVISSFAIFNVKFFMLN